MSNDEGKTLRGGCFNCRPCDPTRRNRAGSGDPAYRKGIAAPLMGLAMTTKTAYKSRRLLTPMSGRLSWQTYGIGTMRKPTLEL